MSDTFNSQSKTIGELLGPNLRQQLVVPAFQRGFSWEKKHVQTFWQDVLNFASESSQSGGPEKYFLGPIVILHDGKERINLLDGQQRLATATILLAVLRDKCRQLGTNSALDFKRDIQTGFIEKPDDAGYSLVLGELDKTFFIETVQADPPQLQKTTLRSHRNILNAKAFLTDAINGYVSGLDPTKSLLKIKKLVQILRSDFVVASIPVDSERDAFRIFETLNDRGLRLSVPDLLLNFLMKKAADANDRAQVRDLWNEMLERMGRRDINKFMRHMWVSKYGDLKKTDLFSALKGHIEKNSIDSLGFTRACVTECDAYASLVDIDNRFGSSVMPILKSLIRTLDFQVALPVLLSSCQCLTEQNFERVARFLLVYLVRYSVIAGLDPAGMETVLFELAREIRTRMEAGKTAEQACVTHVKKTLKDSSPSDEKVLPSAEELTVSPEEAGYLMSRLASHMQSKTKEVSIAEANVEHIFPRNPAKNAWGGKKVQDSLEPLVWHVGNLTILGTRINREAGNREFAEKIVDYEKSEVEMTRAVAKYKTWGQAEIVDRAKKLSKQMLEVWNFDNPSRV